MKRYYSLSAQVTSLNQGTAHDAHTLLLPQSRSASFFYFAVYTNSDNKCLNSFRILIKNGYGNDKRENRTAQN